MYGLRIRSLSNNIPRTLKPLLEYLPLQEHQLTKFSPNSSFEAMQTGPVPWVGLLVDFVKGEYKGQRGTVRDVNRYTVEPFTNTRRSGLTLSIERHTFSSNSSNQIVKVDYDAARYHTVGVFSLSQQLDDHFPCSMRYIHAYSQTVILPTQHCLHCLRPAPS